MKVWILNGPMNAGGTESLIMELLRNRDERVDVKLIIHSPNGKNQGIYDEEIKALGIERYDLPSVGSVGEKAYAKVFKALVDKIGKPDVIHSNMNAVGGIICKVAKRYGIEQRIVHCHADIKYKGSRLSVIKSEIGLWLMKKYVNKYANHYWACSEAAAKRLFYKGKNTTVIPNVIDVRKYAFSEEKRRVEREKLGITEEIIAVGAVGRIAPIKNYETIINAVSILKSKNKNVHFYCYGGVVDDLYHQTLLSLAEEKGVKERIHFLGVSSKINENLNAFDVYVMPSITEGLGISALEAQAIGLPTIISTGVPKETDMGLGIVERVSVEDANAWAEKILSSNKVKPDSDKILSAFIEKGYDSKTTCKKIYQKYIDMVSDNELN